MVNSILTILRVFYRWAASLIALRLFQISMLFASCPAAKSLAASPKASSPTHPGGLLGNPLPARWISPKRACQQAPGNQPGEPKNTANVWYLTGETCGVSRSLLLKRSPDVGPRAIVGYDRRRAPRSDFSRAGFLGHFPGEAHGISPLGQALPPGPKGKTPRVTPVKATRITGPSELDGQISLQGSLRHCAGPRTRPVTTTFCGHPCFGASRDKRNRWSMALQKPTGTPGDRLIEGQ